MSDKARKIRIELLKTMIQLATAGFGLVAALAWNEAIQGLIQRLIPSDQSNLWSKLVYAVIVTAIAVLVTSILGRMLQSESEEKK